MAVRELQLSEEGQVHLLKVLQEQLSAAVRKQEEREKRYEEYWKAYEAEPATKRKMFPWPDASNVVVPIVAITVDTICARLQKAMLGAKDFCEIEIKNPQWEPAERALRDWIRQFVTTSGTRDRLRTLFFDMTLYGDAYVKPQWVEETREYSQYDEAGNVVQQNIPNYTGVRWHVVRPHDVVYPTDFDEWDKLPWIGHRLRYTVMELKELEDQGFYHDVDGLADDPNDDFAVVEVYEIQGKFRVEDRYEEVILTYSLERNRLIREIHNPFFGKARHFVRVPFLLQAHKLEATGAAKQTIQQQEEASTIHNQVLDAATAANAGIIVTSPEADLGQNQEIYPGKHIVTSKPREDVAVYHLSEASPTLQRMEQQSAFYAEKRSGVSSYSMGVESQIAGSRATATGTTALIAEGNNRFWVSIDDARHAIQELLYLTLQLEQQFRPKGLTLPNGTLLVLPPGDIRTSIGLKLTLTSESVNRDLELQNLQILMGVLNEYYARLMQAGAMILNPQFPPPQKQMAMGIMAATQNIIKRFVERFDVENIDEVVPNLLALLQGQAYGQQAPQAMAGSLPAGPGGMAPGGAGPGGPTLVPGAGVNGAVPPTGASAVPQTPFEAGF